MNLRKVQTEPIFFFIPFRWPGILIRIIISSVKYCNKAALREAQLKTAESQRHVVFRVFIMSGLLINAACAITIFIFTQTQRDMNGKITFNVPTTLLEDQYNDQRYFQVRLGRETACVRAWVCGLGYCLITSRKENTRMVRGRVCGF